MRLIATAVDGCGYAVRLLLLALHLSDLPLLTAGVRLRAVNEARLARQSTGSTSAPIVPNVAQPPIALSAALDRLRRGAGPLNRTASM